MKKALFLILNLAIATSCATNGKPTSFNQAFAGRKVANDDCPKDITPKEDHDLENTVIAEFKAASAPKHDLTGKSYQCFFADNGYRTSSMTLSAATGGIENKNDSTLYGTKTRSGLVGHYLRSVGIDSRNEIRVGRKGNLVIEYSLRKRNDGCSDRNLSASDPENFAVQHMEICVPATKFRNSLFGH